MIEFLSLKIFDKENKSDSVSKPKFIPQFKAKINSFRTPIRNASLPVQTAANKTEENDANNDIRYYNVMWYV